MFLISVFVNEQPNDGFELSVSPKTYDNYVKKLQVWRVFKILFNND